MSIRLNKEAYTKLIDEDIAWLNGMPRSLERDHIKCVLQESIGLHYPERIKDEVWHKASEERPTRLPIIHVWYHGTRVSDVTTHEDKGLQAEIDDINFQPDDKWAYLDDLLNIRTVSGKSDPFKELKELKELEKASEDYAYTNWESDDYHEGASEGKPFDPIGFTAKVFKAGAQWYKEQIKRI